MTAPDHVVEPLKTLLRDWGHPYMGTSADRIMNNRRRRWPDALKRQIVAETLEPGSSVSIVARRHDVNANQLFQWRRRMLAQSPANGGSSLLPVEIVPEPGRD